MRLTAAAVVLARVATLTAAHAPHFACSLNGAVDAGSKCVCFPGWKGDQCAVMDIAPHPNNYVPAYGFAPNVTSWGGNAIRGDDGKFHLFVSEIPGSGLHNWGTLSQIVHATGDDVMGVFTKTDVVLPAFAHNAAPVRAPANHLACPGCWYLFHIGHGPGFAHRALSPDGPWTHLEPSFHCNNPAPAFANNGSMVLVCNSVEVWASHGDPANTSDWAKIGFVNESDWVSKAPEYLRVEDAFLWQDPKDSWHLFVHFYDYRDGYPTNPNQTMPILVAGHAYSRDLVSWTLSPTPPFGNIITYTNGTVQNFATLERPHLVFDKLGWPTHLLHGASPVWDQYGAPCNVCAPRPGSEHSCVVCKTTPGFDWTYTLAQKLREPAVATLMI